jgi:hypothetical protein
MAMKTFVILFEVEASEWLKETIPQNIRAALESRAMNPSGIDIWEKGKEPIMRRGDDKDDIAGALG